MFLREFSTKTNSQKDYYASQMAINSMEASNKEIGKGKVPIDMLLVTFMLVTSKEAKRMEWGRWYLLMEMYTRDSGKMVRKTDEVDIDGWMRWFSKVNFGWINGKDKVHSFTPMNQELKAIGAMMPVTLLTPTLICLPQKASDNLRIYLLKLSFLLNDKACLFFIWFSIQSLPEQLLIFLFDNSIFIT